MNRRKPDRIRVPETTPTQFDVKLHEGNKKVIRWLQGLMVKR
ncbi:hypothetical protein RCG17_00720 [Neobacillus sp. PS3-12]|nr:hypothetical protein [Neobacillus sp. PS3-12]WML53270.1 hypothetical protein RCG17_00720 [Neobacillus sp. PS3-12]